MTAPKLDGFENCLDHGHTWVKKREKDTFLWTFCLKVTSSLN